MNREREDRRRHPRERVEAPCKVYQAATGKYLAGRARDVSRSGVMIELLPGPALLPGEAVGIGMGAASLLGREDLIPARVVWSDADRAGARRVAVEFEGLRQGDVRRP